MKAHRFSAWLITGYLFAGVISFFAVLRLTSEIMNGSQLQFEDYWLMIDSLVLPDGNLNLPGLLVFNNEHPLVIPKLIYWLNIKFFDGANIPLGLFNICIVCAQLFLVARMLKYSTLHQAEKIAIFVLAISLLLGLPGSWNFVKSMSGAAWLTANLFAFAAIYLRAINKCCSAFVMAILATMSYGTGAAVWLAIVVVGITLRPPRDWWREWPYLLGLLTAILWVQSQSAGAATNVLGSYFQLAQAAAAQLGFSVTNSAELGALFGWIPLIGIPLLAPWLSIWIRCTDDAGWIGLATFGWSNIVLIIYGRSEIVTWYGVAARYHSIGAITWLGFTVLVLLTIQTLATKHNRRHESQENSVYRFKTLPLQSILAIVLLVPISYGAITAGITPTVDLRKTKGMQDFRAMALRLELVDGTKFMETFSGKIFNSTKLLKDISHYPFSDKWSNDCGLLGETINDPVGQPEVGFSSTDPVRRTPQHAFTISGLLPDDFSLNDPVQCIVVTDAVGTVVGVGQVELSTGKQNKLYFTALAPKGSSHYSVYVVDEKGKIVKLKGRIVGDDFRPA